MARNESRAGPLRRDRPPPGKTPGRGLERRNGSLPGRVSRPLPRLPYGAPSDSPHGRSGCDSGRMEAETPPVTKFRSGTRIRGKI